MQVVTGNKKIRILFYVFLFIFLSTISFFERTSIFGDNVFFPINKIEIFGNQKIDHVKMQRELNSLIGQNLLLMNPENIEEILDKNKLIKKYTIQKKYPNTINI